MSVVLDASVTLAWVHSDDSTKAVVDLFDWLVGKDAWVPNLWHLEVANVLQKNVRRGLYAMRVRDRHLQNLRGLSILTDDQTVVRAWAETLDLSGRHGLTVYDASYLELALRRTLPLATLDGKLRDAANRENVPLLGL